MRKVRRNQISKAKKKKKFKFRKGVLKLVASPVKSNRLD